MSVSFFVHGVPQTQGSMRAFIANGRPILTSTNKSLADWRRLIADAAQEHAHLFEGAVEVDLSFYLPRPKSLPKKITEHTKKPDIDKLARAALDALTGVFFQSDAQVVALEAIKRYGTERIGVGIWISEVPTRA